jgi:predicted transcriptional regulator
MTRQPHLDLSRRERQIMNVLYRNGRATAAEIREQLPNKPSYSAVRAMLRILEEKGHIRHEEESLRYVFMPTIPREKAKRSALRDLLETFFEGSAEKAVAALLDQSSTRLSKAELDRLSQLIEEARREGE